MVRKLVCSTFYLFEYSFDGVPISAGDVSKSEITAMEGGVEPRRAIDEELGVFDLMFRVEFSQEPSRERGRTGWRSLTWRKSLVSGSNAATSQ